MKIHKAIKEDLSSLVDLSLEFQKFEMRFDKDLVINEQTEKEIRRELKKALGDPNEIIFIAREGKKGIGYIGFGFYPGFSKNGVIKEIFVKKSARRKGIGSKLMEGAFDWLKRKEVKKVKISCYKKNKTAPAFYKKFGFEREPEKIIDLRREI